MYKYFNLLILGASFANMIFILGRYYCKKWIVLFNIALAIDLKDLYR